MNALDSLLTANVIAELSKSQGTSWSIEILEMCEKLWPVSAFESREAWRAYVDKWLPIITKDRAPKPEQKPWQCECIDCQWERRHNMQLRVRKQCEA